MKKSTGRFRDLGTKRRVNAAGQHVARTGWLLITLLHGSPVEYATYLGLFGVDRRTFQRDVRAVAEIVAPHGCSVDHTKGGRVFLGFSDRLARVRARTVSAAATLTRIAGALGGPLENELRECVALPMETNEVAIAVSPFLQPREPLPAASARVTRVFNKAKKAAGDHALLEFSYTSAKRERTTRRAEPYHVIAWEGRYYLVAYDRVPRGWRKFALDAIDESTLRSIGSFSPRRVPASYLAHRAVGWISGQADTEVTYRLSPRIAASVAASILQPEQRLTQFPDGSAEITLCFSDLNEAARWSLKFGAEALVIAPAEAVAFARRLSAEILTAYESLRSADVILSAPEGSSSVILSAPEGSSRRTKGGYAPEREAG